MAYKMKGHTLPGINQKGNKGMEDGRANSSPFQQDEGEGEKSEIRAHNFRAPAPNPEAKMSRIGVDKRPKPKTPDFPPRLERGKPKGKAAAEKPVKKEGGSSTKGKGTIYKQMTR